MMKRIFCCDKNSVDPKGTKNSLSEYANDALEDVWKNFGKPSKIIICDQKLDYSGDMKILRFGIISDRKYDGVHMRSEQGVQQYTQSFIEVIPLALLPSLLPSPVFPGRPAAASSQQLAAAAAAVSLPQQQSAGGGEEGGTVPL